MRRPFLSDGSHFWWQSTGPVMFLILGCSIFANRSFLTNRHTMATNYMLLADIRAIHAIRTSFYQLLLRRLICLHEWILIPMRQNDCWNSTLLSIRSSVMMIPSYLLLSFDCCDTNMSWWLRRICSLYFLVDTQLSLSKHSRWVLSFFFLHE